MPVEYRLRLVQTQNSGAGHVHLMFFVLISFALGSQRQPSFQWNMGLIVSVIKDSLLSDKWTFNLIEEEYLDNILHEKN